MTMKENQEKIMDLISSLSSDISHTKDDVSDIKKAILGDDYGNYGIQQRLKKAEERIASLQKDRWILYGIGFAITSLASYIIFFLK